MNPLLVTMRGPDEIDFSKLSNFEAGIAFMGLLAREYPGMTMSELLSMTSAYQYPEKMAGLFDFVGRQFTSAKDFIGDTLKSTVNLVGGVAGSAVRLVTDPKVLTAAETAAAAYATGGGSVAVQGTLNSLTGSGTSGTGSIGDQILGFINSLGENSKAQINSAGMSGASSPGWVWPVVIGGVGLVGVVALTRGGKKRR